MFPFVLTVIYANVNDITVFIKGNFNKNHCINSKMRRTECLFGRSPGLNASFVPSKVKDSDISGVLPRQSTLNLPKSQEMNQMFKVPNFNTLPVTKGNVKSLISPRRRVQTGRVKNDAKKSQQSKMSFLPRASFTIPTRKSIHYGKGNQISARKELIKKMVYLAEVALKENKPINPKQSTPVKLPAGLTPRKTPKSRGFLMLPEFKKTMPRLEALGTPIQDMVRENETVTTTMLMTPVALDENEGHDPSEDNKLNDKVNVEDSLLTYLKNNKGSGTETFNRVLRHCQNYNNEVNNVFLKLSTLESVFENNIKGIPDYEVYNEFGLYQSKKEELYDDLKQLEDNLKESMRSQTQVGAVLKDYIDKRRKLFDKRSQLHKDFEKVVEGALEKCERLEEETVTTVRKVTKGVRKEEKEEKPTVRRSLRLSKIPKKINFEERTPMTRRLEKLDSKSRGIKKGRKL